MLAQGHNEVMPVRMILKVLSNFNIPQNITMSITVYNCFSIDKFNSSIIIKYICLFFSIDDKRSKHGMK